VRPFYVACQSRLVLDYKGIFLRCQNKRSSTNAKREQ
jgi:hypothetical protein